MPIVKSKYKRPPRYLLNGHFETIIPSLYYRVQGVHYERERLELADGDFLDLDWIKRKNRRLMVLSHGLEGDSGRHYILRPAKLFSTRGWDILAWNNRSCSGEMNRLPRFYHHGATEDIAAVIDRALTEEYEEIVLVGFSMGGGMQQKYLGERAVDQRIKGAVSFSVPCNVWDSACTLSKPQNRFYERRFVSKLKKKVMQKALLMEMPIDLEALQKATNFQTLDETFTLKIHTEYKDAMDFYDKITSDQYLPDIKIPLYIVNAANDPMLGEKCYPVALAEGKKNIYLEIPPRGGHVGFTLAGRKEYTYMEQAITQFLDEIMAPFLQNRALRH